MSAVICNEKNWERTTNLERLAIEPEILGPRHSPVPHADALGLFKERIGDNGITITKETGLLSQDEMKYIYVAEVKDTAISDLALTMGFINFNNKKKAFTGLFGERVFVCSNEMFHGETIHDNRRHTTNIWGKLNDKVDSIVEKFKRFREIRLKEIEQLKDHSMTDSDVGEMVVNIMRNHILSNTNTARLVKEWDHPTHPDFLPRNMWSFQNHFTEVAKRISDPGRRIKATHNFGELIKEMVAA